MERMYRVLINGELSTILPLAQEVEGYDGAAVEEFCGYGCEGDFTGAAENGRGGEVWQFVTNQPAAMEQALDSDPAVIAYKEL